MHLYISHKNKRPPSGNQQGLWGIRSHKKFNLKDAKTSYFSLINQTQQPHCIVSLNFSRFVFVLCSFLPWQKEKNARSTFLTAVRLREFHLTNHKIRNMRRHSISHRLHWTDFLWCLKISGFFIELIYVYSGSRHAVYELRFRSGSTTKSHHVRFTASRVSTEERETDGNSQLPELGAEPYILDLWIRLKETIE